MSRVFVNEAMEALSPLEGGEAGVEGCLTPLGR